MALAFVRSATLSKGGGSATRAVSFSSLPATTGGPLIVVFIDTYNNTGPPIVSVADNQGNTYTLANSIQHDSELYYTYIYYCVPTTSSGTFTVTVTMTSSCFMAVGASEFSGAAGTEDVGAADHGASTTTATGAMNPTGTCLYVDCIGQSQTYSAMDPVTGTALYDDATADFGWAAQYYIGSGSQNLSWTRDPTGSWTAVGATFNEAAGGARKWILGRP